MTGFELALIGVMLFIALGVIPYCVRRIEDALWHEFVDPITDWRREFDELDWPQWANIMERDS